MTNLDRFLENSHQLRRKAIDTPYSMTSRSLITQGKLSFGMLDCSECTEEFILNSCNTAEIKDEMIRVMSKALEQYRYVSSAKHGVTQYSAAAEALAKVEELAK